MYDAAMMVEPYAMLNRRMTPKRIVNPPPMRA